MYCVLLLLLQQLLLQKRVCACVNESRLASFSSFQVNLPSSPLMAKSSPSQSVRLEKPSIGDRRGDRPLAASLSHTHAHTGKQAGRHRRALFQAVAAKSSSSPI